MTASLLFIALILLTHNSVALACCAHVSTPTQGTFFGNCLQLVEEYRGIPYAQPMTGQRRFSKTLPVEPYTSSEKRNATVAGPVCRQPLVSFGQQYERLSEDCLYLNVYRPRHVAQPLPVMVWIHGGSFLQGSGSDDVFNATNFLERSILLKKPVIYVSFNYRLGAFGFLSGKAMATTARSGNTTLNAAYWDQREALRWVQLNIASFGGDPGQVTLFGESAGASSVGQQMLANDGNVEGLFRAAIMESGSPSLSRRYPADDAYPQDRYDILLAAAGCDSTISDEAQIACLRNVPSDVLDVANTAAATNQQTPFAPVQDDYFVRGLPSAQFKRGLFPPIPFITGNNVDEGTFFSTSQNITTDHEFENAILTLYGPTIKPLLPRILKLWPNIPAAGSPYLPFLFGDSPNDTYFGEGNQFKRLSSFAGDLLFESGRRQQLQAGLRTHRDQIWSYRFAQPLALSILSPGLNTAAYLGVPHATELAFVYNNPVLAGRQISQVPEPLRAYTTDEKLTEIARIMSSAWIHFAHHLNPRGTDVPHWPPYGSNIDSRGAGINLYLQGGNVSLQQDSYQWKQTSFLLEHPQTFFI